MTATYAPTVEMAGLPLQPMRIRDLLVAIGASAFQRNEIPHRVDNLVKNWDENLFEPPTVARNSEGTLLMPEGKHRTLAAAQVYGEDAVIPVRVAQTDKPGALFIKLSKAKRTIRPVTVFNAKIVDGDPVAVKALEIAHDIGLEVDNGKSAFIINGTNTILTLCEKDPATLANTLRILKEIIDSRGGDETGWLRANVIEAVFYLLANTSASSDRLVKRLKTVNPFVAAPYNAKDARKNAVVMADIYNSGLRHDSGSRIMTD